MFSFGFSADDITLDVEKSNKSKDIAKVRESRELKSNEFRKIEEHLKSCSLSYKELKGNVRYIENQDAMFALLRSDDEEFSEVLKAEVRHSDLLPGIYEGGCKIWEATHDVIDFIEIEQINFQNKKVLDLGCGAGLIGITCLTKEATCFFQDYNDEVLKYVTYPNVRANEDNILQFNVSRCKFFCGDWTSFVELWQKEYQLEEKFDYIITCETIYNPGSYEKLHSVFQNLLSPQGIMYLFGALVLLNRVLINLPKCLYLSNFCPKMVSNDLVELTDDESEVEIRVGRPAVRVHDYARTEGARELKFSG